MMNYLHYVAANPRFFVRRSLPTITSHVSSSFKTASCASDAANSIAQLEVA